MFCRISTLYARCGGDPGDCRRSSASARLLAASLPRRRWWTTASCPVAGGPARSITVADRDGDDARDRFIAGAIDGPDPNAVVLKRGQRYALDRAHPLARVGNVRAALWGDLDDDGLIDVVLCRTAGGTQIWKQSPAGRWLDATAASGVRFARTDIVDGAVLDADHDGDLDIWLVNAAGPNEF